MTLTSTFDVGGRADGAGTPAALARGPAASLRLDIERVPLDGVADAWRRQAEGAGTKLVVVP